MSNIQVAVRCRGRNDKEVAAKSPIVIDLPNDTFSVTDPYVSINHNYTTQTVSSLSNANSSGSQSRRSSTNNSGSPFSNYKTYKVDQVYGSQADQNLIFEKVALPLFNDFLQGSNVTILAYGQTGTGKTFTMCGGEQKNSNVDYKHSETAGIIPRVLIELFNKLEPEGAASDYVVKCSFLELYNEDLKDLLNDDEKPAKLRIYESTVAANGNKKEAGKASKTISIQNLREESILSCQDGFQILQKGLLKRKTASTKLNDVSSRSHTLFTINLYRNQPGSDGTGSQLFKVSKMNLVDLAGSENIYRSGAQNQRAKEAGSINQSLLTLGRVINSLSELANSSNADNTFHIPYRESKLTRLLQDSIGGCTKTSLIATISPAKINIDETISTLDYACKAKNIKNLPQSGHDSDLIMKRVLVKNLSQEIAKLNFDLIATRNKNGIWLNEDNYNAIMEENESLKASLKESNLQNELLNSKISQFEVFKANNENNIKKLREQINKQVGINEELSNESTLLKSYIVSKDEEIKQLSEQLVKANEKFSSTTNQLVKVIYRNLDTSINSIQDILSQYNNSANGETLFTFNTQLTGNIENFRKSLEEKIAEINDNLANSLLQDLPYFLEKYNENYDKLSTLISSLNSQLMQNLSDLKVANDKLSGYIIEDHLNYNAQELISQLIETKVSSQLTKLHEKMDKSIATILRDSKQNYKKLFETSISQISQELIESERNEISKREKNWSTETSRVLNVIDLQMYEARQEEVEQSKAIFDSLSMLTTERLTDLKNKTTENLSKLTELVSNEENPKVSLLQRNLPCLEDISKNIQLNDIKIRDSLTTIDKSLQDIKQFDAKQAFKLSPVRGSKQIEIDGLKRSPSRSPSYSNPPSRTASRQISPIKTAGTLARTKIPQLNRSLDNKENQGPSQKRRRVLQQVDNFLHG